MIFKITTIIFDYEPIAVVLAYVINHARETCALLEPDSMIVIPQAAGTFPTTRDLEEIAKWGHLLDDLQFSLSNPELLVEADHEMPTLEDWRLSIRSSPCLAGRVVGHPVLYGDRREIMTSEVVLLAPDVGLARTWSRWYRLGSCEDENGMRNLLSLR